MARVEVLAALRQLDGGRKGLLMQFLFEAGLITGTYSSNDVIIDLSGADLSYAYLTETADITLEELEKEAKTLQGATMPDGSKHP